MLPCRCACSVAARGGPPLDGGSANATGASMRISYRQLTSRVLAHSPSPPAPSRRAGSTAHPALRRSAPSSAWSSVSPPASVRASSSRPASTARATKAHEHESRLLARALRRGWAVLRTHGAGRLRYRCRTSDPQGRDPTITIAKGPRPRTTTISIHDTLAKPPPHHIATQCLDVEWDPETSEALWQLCRTSAAVYNATLAMLREEPDVPRKGKAGADSLQKRLTGWRRDPAHPAAHLPVMAARAAVAQAHAAQAAWEATQDEHAKAIVDARDAGKEIPRRVQHARVSDGPRMRKRKALNREGRNGCSFVEGVRCPNTRTVVLPGGLRLRTTRGIADGGDVVSCQIVERTPRRYARRRRCEPKDRTFAVHLQRRVATPLNTSVRRVRYEKGMRPTHYVDPDRVAEGVVGTDTGVVRELTLVGPDRGVTVVEGPTERQRAQDERARKKAERLGKGRRRTKRKGKPGRRAEAAQRIRKHNARRRASQRRDRVCKAVKRALTAPSVTAVATDALALENMTASARGTQETPGKNVAAKRGLNRSLAHAAPGETNAIVRRCAEKLGLWVVEGRPAYGSVTCPRCSHVDRDSRESQSLFRCTACGHVDHADTNAARVSQLRARKRLSAYLGARRSRRNPPRGCTSTRRYYAYWPVPEHSRPAMGRLAALGRRVYRTEQPRAGRECRSDSYAPTAP